MGIDTCKAIPVPRPNTLLLENTWNTAADSNNNMNMVDTNEVNNKSGVTVNRRRKKKRAADAGVKKFEGKSLHFHHKIIWFTQVSLATG